MLTAGLPELYECGTDPGTRRTRRKAGESGRYRSVSEVVSEALRLMNERDQILVLQKDEIEKIIGEGLESLRAGKRVDGDAVFDRIEVELDALERSGHR